MLFVILTDVVLKRKNEEQEEKKAFTKGTEKEQ